MEQPEGILQLIDQPGNTSGEALEQPEGILQLTYLLLVVQTPPPPVEAL